MSHQYSRDGSIWTTSEGRTIAATDCLRKAAEADAASVIYMNIGYPGNAAAAARQAEILRKASGKILRSEGVSDYERRGFEG
jgi:hypothetical protein